MGQGIFLGEALLSLQEIKVQSVSEFLTVFQCTLEECRELRDERELKDGLNQQLAAEIADVYFGTAGKDKNGAFGYPTVIQFYIVMLV